MGRARQPWQPTDSLGQPRVPHCWGAQGNPGTWLVHLASHWCDWQPRATFSDGASPRGRYTCYPAPESRRATRRDA
eukprot:3067787-Pyramimonas_sp.AAC.1